MIWPIWPSAAAVGKRSNPSGSSRIYDVTVGLGRTALADGVTYVGFGGTVTDLRFLSVAGKATLVAGTDSGGLSRVPTLPQSSLTLKRGEGAEDTILRTQIDKVESTGKSLMPEGLEMQMTKQDVADLIGYLQKVGSPR